MLVLEWDLLSHAWISTWLGKEYERDCKVPSMLCFTMLAVVVSFFPSIWPLFGFQGLRASRMWCQNRWVPNLRRLSSRRQAELTAVSDDGYLNASHTRVAARAAAIFGQRSCTQKCECCDPSGVCAWQPNPLQDYLAQGKTTALCHGICHLSVCWCFASPLRWSELHTAF